MNIYDVAREANVSVATVSRVLNNHKNVKESTRKKVMDVIKGKDFVPNSAAKNLSMGESRNIALIVPDIENPFFAKLLHGLSDQAIEFGYNVFMFGTDEDTERELQILESLKSELLRGLVMIPVSEDSENTKVLLNRFREASAPVVLIDRDVRGGDFDGVFSQDDEGAFNAVECLIKAGHRKIAIIRGSDTSRPGYERYRGYKKALAKYNIELRKEYCPYGDFMEENSYQAMKKLMSLENPPTAVFSSNNMTTLGCLRYFKENNLKIGRDISIVGFDDIKELRYTDIDLTVVDRPVYEMGVEAMKLLRKAIETRDKADEDGLFVKRNFIKTRLIKRGSEFCERLGKGESGSLDVD